MHIHRLPLSLAITAAVSAVAQSRTLSPLIDMTSRIHPTADPPSHVGCNSPIYCEGPLLKTVQMARLFSDSKTFVDMPTALPVDQVLAAFDAIGGVNATRQAIAGFVNTYFQEPSSELVQVELPFYSNLSWLDKVEDSVYRGWISHLHHTWSDLTFEFNTTGLCDGCVSSTLPVKRPFVVPGGRFREFYYWDTYFVIRGLLLSDLDGLAKDMLENLLDFVDTYGFMPNGARVYYLNRSQPPLLSEMIKAYHEKTGDDAFVKKALPVLDKEYNYWRTNTRVAITDNATESRYILNRYNVYNDAPRPESYVEDYEAAHLDVQLNDSQIIDLYSNLATGAETGWDYSSRWTRLKSAEDTPHAYTILRSLNTRNIVPVDLNAILWGMESTLYKWHRAFDSTPHVSYWYKRQANMRLEAMDALLWNPEHNSFYDFNLTSHAQNIEYTPASLYPFWLGAIPERVKNPEVLQHVFDSTREVLYRNPGILTTSIYNTTLQWDWPNGWPPLQYIAIRAILNVANLLQDDADNLHTLAHQLAERNAASAFCSWFRTGGSVAGLVEKLPGVEDDGHMFEKFDVRYMGAAGLGGEYTVQVGFGWTNGVVLWIFNTFANLTAPACDTSFEYDIEPSMYKKHFLHV